MMTNAKTKLCCIIGSPVEHSLSPSMHNAGYQALGINFVFVGFHVDDLKSAIKGLRALNARGIVVTVPHKIEVMDYIDEIDETARKIGAVNTIVNNDGKLQGSNTDWIGGIGALEKVVKLPGKTVALLGAGGAARAIAYGLKKKGAKVQVFNRTVKKAKDLVSHFGLEGASNLSATEKIRAVDIIVNTTSLGMEPDINSAAISQDAIRKGQVVYDIVYTPKETKLLKMTKQKGAKVVYGDKMVFYGAIPQFELFTGKKAPQDAMLKALEKAEEVKKV